MNDIRDSINELYRMLALPLIAIIVGAAALLGIWIGSAFLLAGGDEQKIKKAKDRLKYAVIGITVIFVVAALMPLVVAMLQEWSGI